MHILSLRIVGYGGWEDIDISAGDLRLALADDHLELLLAIISTANVRVKALPRIVLDLSCLRDGPTREKEVLIIGQLHLLLVANKFSIDIFRRIVEVLTFCSYIGH